MKNLVEYLNESKVNVQDLIRDIKDADKLDPKTPGVIDKLNVMAMDALDIYWQNANWEKRVNSELYELYQSSFEAEYKDKDLDKVKEILISVVNKVIELAK